MAQETFPALAAEVPAFAGLSYGRWGLRDAARLGDSILVCGRRTRPSTAERTGRETGRELDAFDLIATLAKIGHVI